MSVAPKALHQLQACRSRGWHPQILADQEGGGGGRLCPSNYYWHPRIFRPSNGPGIPCYFYLVNLHLVNSTQLQNCCLYLMQETTTEILASVEIILALPKSRRFVSLCCPCQHFLESKSLCTILGAVHILCQLGKGRGQKSPILLTLVSRIDQCPY